MLQAPQPRLRERVRRLREEISQPPREKAGCFFFRDLSDTTFFATLIFLSLFWSGRACKRETSTLFGGGGSKPGALFFFLLLTFFLRIVGAKLGRTLSDSRGPQREAKVAGRRDAPLMVDSQISIKTTKRTKINHLMRIQFYCVSAIPSHSRPALCLQGVRSSASWLAR